MPAFYLIDSCSGSTSGVVDFGAFTPTDGAVYAMIFSGGNFSDGCYTVISADTSPVDGVTQTDSFQSCQECVEGREVNLFYEYSAEILGNFSGGTIPPDTPIPHPIYPSGLGVAIQMNAITIGGFNGLNN